MSAPASSLPAPRALLVLLAGLAALGAGCVRLGFRAAEDGAAPRDRAGGEALVSEGRTERRPGLDLGLDLNLDRPFDTGARLDRARLDKAPGDQPPLAAGFAFVKSSTFTMGSPTTEPCHSAFEDLHQVTLSRSYEIATTEVTVAQFQAVMAYNPSPWASCGASCPVVNLSWHEAAGYCNKLSKNKGLAQCYVCTGAAATTACTEASAYAGKAIYTCPGYRLPTEAEWEGACRAGKTTAYYNGPNTATCATCTVDSILDAIAWYCVNSNNVPHPVGLRQANSLGLYDMSGNAWEWCHDGFLDTAAGSLDPVAAPTGPNRVTRGGSFYMPPGWTRAALRNADGATLRHDDTGFRCARSLP